MSADLITRVESACTQLVQRGETVTFAAVATHAGVAKATLYRRPELRAIVEEHRRGDREAIPSAASSSNSTSFAKNSKLSLPRSAGMRRNFALCGVRSPNRNDKAQATSSCFAIPAQFVYLRKTPAIHHDEIDPSLIRTTSCWFA